MNTIHQNGYLILDVPEKYFDEYEINNAGLTFYHPTTPIKTATVIKLPAPGDWQIICKGNEASEEVAKEIVESRKHALLRSRLMFRDYSKLRPVSWINDPIKSLHSLIRSKGMEPERVLILFNKNHK